MTFDDVYAAAMAVPTSGWDFTVLAGRWEQGPKPWAYREIVRRAARDKRVVVDLGTGGGEWWSSLALDNEVQVATECWRPNLAVAAARLRPRGVHVLTHPPAPDNVEWRAGTTEGALPLRDRSVGLLHSRHESYSPAEVARVLAPGGCFVTQQVGAEPYGELADAVGAQRVGRGWTLDFATEQLAAAGVGLVDGAQARVPITVRDIGVVVHLARMDPALFPGFEPSRDVEPLRALHDVITRDGAFVTHWNRFWLRAELG